MKKNNIFKVLSILCVIILSLLYWFYHHKVYLSSDSVTFLPMANDIAHGNILLKKWIAGSNSFYFTDTIFYVIGIMFGLKSYFLIYFIPGIFWSGLSVLGIIYFLELRDSSHNYREKIILSVACFSIIAVIPSSSSYTLLNANSHNNLYLFIIFEIIIAILYLNDKARYLLVVYMLLEGMLYFSDTITLMTLFAPMLCVCIVNALRKNKIKKQVILLGANLLGILFGKLMSLLFTTWGIQIRGIPIKIADTSTWGERFFAFKEQFYILLNYTGIRSSHDLRTQVYNWIMFFFLIGFVLTIIYNTIFIFKIKLKSSILYFCTVINLGACIVTDVNVHYRYIVPTFLFGTFLVFSTLNNMHVLNNNMHLIRNFVTIMVVVVCLFVITVKVHDIIQLPNANENERKVANFIEDKGWSGGYGDFWAGPIISFYTDYRVPCYPVAANIFDKLEMWSELINKNWANEENKHFVIKKENDVSFFSEQLVENTFGQPDEKYTMNGFSIYYWEKDISKEISR